VVRGKLQGVGHLWHAASGTYTLPIRKNGPYEWSICLGCHEGAKKYEAIEEHEGIADDPMADGAACIDCHEPVHPAPETRAGP
jgi:hypothetical protein